MNDENPTEFNCTIPVKEDQEIEKVAIKKDSGSGSGSGSESESEGEIEFEFQESPGVPADLGGVDITKSSMANNTESNINEQTGDGSELTEMLALVIKKAELSNRKLMLSLDPDFLSEFPETKSFQFNATDIDGKNVLFKCKQKADTEYECIPNKKYNGTLNGAMGRFDDGKPFMLNYPNEEDTLNVPGGSNTYSIAKKSDEGLTKGGIVAICLTLAFAVIAAIIATLICKNLSKKRVNPIQDESVMVNLQQKSSSS